jgi:hypothetical protein
MPSLSERTVSGVMRKSGLGSGKPASLPRSSLS